MGRRKPCFESLESRMLLAASPVLMADILPPSAGYDPAQMDQILAFEGDVYFTGTDGVHGHELWRSHADGSPPTLLKDINPDAAGSSPYSMQVSGGRLFFTANDGVHGVALWITDGTEEGTVMLKDIDPSTTGGTIGSCFDYNGTLLFIADDGVHGTELWKSDGTPDGTKMVKDINTVSGASNPGSFTLLNGIVYFGAYESQTGTELWRTDGTEDGTYRVKDINPGGASGFLYLAKSGGRLYLSANDGVHGYELWKSDGTEAGTEIVADIYPFGTGSFPGTLTDVSGTLYFAATDPDNGTELWKSDGSTAGTMLVKNIRQFSASSTPLVYGDLDGIAIFTANDGTHGREAWRSDGTSAGTFMLGEISPGNNFPFIGYFNYQNGLMYFSADDLGVNYGTELYVTDGTVAGTHIAADLWPGTLGSSPRLLQNVGGEMYFVAGGGVPHAQLWKLPDEIAPRAVSGSADVETAHRLKLRFTEDLSQQITAAILKVQAVGGGPIFTPDSVTFDKVTRIATFSFANPLADGNYTATIQAGSIQDAAGYALTSTYSFPFFILSADANRDRRVNNVDLVQIAINWQGTGKTFSQGDFNYDGMVNSADLGILATRWQQTLTPPAIPSPPVLTQATRPPARTPVRTVTLIPDLVS